MHLAATIAATWILASLALTGAIARAVHVIRGSRARCPDHVPAQWADAADREA